MKEKLERELDQLQQQRIITPVAFSEWVASVVPVLKTDGSLQLCGDYRVTINQACQPDSYPLPRVDDLYLLPWKELSTSLNLTYNTPSKLYWMSSHTSSKQSIRTRVYLCTRDFLLVSPQLHLYFRE